MERYCLEIYGEDDYDTPGGTFYSEHPFLAIAVGDLLNPRGFPYWTGRREDPGLLVVTKLEHIVFGTDKDAKHKICVYTRYAPDNRETRAG